MQDISKPEEEGTNEIIMTMTLEGFVTGSKLGYHSLQYAKDFLFSVSRVSYRSSGTMVTPICQAYM